MHFPIRSLRRVRPLLPLAAAALLVALPASLALGAEGEAAAGQTESMLHWIARCSGVIGVVILI